jgi:8-oxo-dGTP pyrophosphatase MutT (NUDIX family)
LHRYSPCRPIPQALLEAKLDDSVSARPCDYLSVSAPRDAEIPVRKRHAARVVLTDRSGRVLLFRGGDPARPSAGTWWFTPGGEVHVGETIELAARRELWEETGLAVADLGPVVLMRHVQFDFRWRAVRPG